MVIFENVCSYHLGVFPTPSPLPEENPWSVDTSTNIPTSQISLGKHLSSNSLSGTNFFLILLKTLCWVSITHIPQQLKNPETLTKPLF